ncbi:putative restriction endonuclease [Bradyrhizobium sp. AZCC 1678]|uniref:HNH endonuclease n=1 Tax=Bradyrhizobium sp. AZCC 1678 TaxID=3117030 RepID=UPI002FF24775
MLLSREDLLSAISVLPDQNRLLPRPYKQQWLDWLSGYDGPGFYGRENSDRTARFIFNRLNNPAMILWLAEASGVDQTLIRQAARFPRTNANKQTQAASVRNIISWEIIEARLQELRSNARPDPLEQVAEARVMLDQPYVPTATTTEIYIDARIGQDRFRYDLIKARGAACEVTGCRIQEILRASHIKPWAVASDRERLDPENGLLLSAHLDALFDSGLISFTDDGTMLISDRIGTQDRLDLQLPQSLRSRPSTRRAKFLFYHRSNRFKHD